MFIFPNGVLFYDMCFMAIRNGILLMIRSGVVFHISLRGVFEDDEVYMRTYRGISIIYKKVMGSPS